MGGGYFFFFFGYSNDIFNPNGKEKDGYSKEEMIIYIKEGRKLVKGKEKRNFKNLKLETRREILENREKNMNRKSESGLVDR